ncbi:Hypothetical Protein OBI_RACECAR_263 [Arthrobacter phage Racecar]|nr:hypothetical protein PBI_RACECAR_55 [Arthrobacter phage Racecar]QFG12739.1 hypothetical protein PBI_MIMI_55 [Arthrobacter phage Mimi]
MEPSKPVEEWDTPDLVREYANVRVHAALLSSSSCEGLNAEQKAWKKAVSDELRKRGVL